MIYLLIYVFILGCMVGSFVNVLIYRIPREQDFIRSRSYCPHCKMNIPFYYNIPILSYIWLRGRCKFCRKRISWRYPLVELVTGGYFLLTFPHLITPLALIHWGLICGMFSILLAHFMIDAKFHILPNGLTFVLFIHAVMYAYLFLSWKYSLWGCVIGFVAPYILSIAFYHLRGIEGLGGGDIKLWSVLGIILGPMGIVQNFFLSSLLGAIVGGIIIISLKKDRNFAIAFGPYIIVVFFVQLHFAKFIPSFLQLF